MYVLGGFFSSQQPIDLLLSCRNDIKAPIALYPAAAPAAALGAAPVAAPIAAYVHDAPNTIKIRAVKRRHVRLPLLLWFEF